MSDVLEINALAKPIPGEACEAVATHLESLGLEVIWIDLMMMNISEERAKQHLHKLHYYSASQCVDTLITWVYTPEGHFFWSDVCDEFYRGNLNPVHLLSKE